MFVTPIAAPKTISFDKKDRSTGEKTGEKGSFTVQSFVFHDTPEVPDPYEALAEGKVFEVGVDPETPYTKHQTYRLGSDSFYKRGNQLAIGRLALVDAE